jgi:hypothetical protein
VKDSFCDNGVGEEAIPVGGLTVGGEDHRGAAPLADELVEVVGLMSLNGCSPKVIDDEDVGAGPASEPSEPRPVGVAAGEVGEDPVGFAEHDPVAPAAGEVPEGLGDVRLAHPDRPVSHQARAPQQSSFAEESADPTPH